MNQDMMKALPNESANAIAYVLELRDMTIGTWVTGIVH